MTLVIGLDTGGTYTDAALLDTDKDLGKSNPKGGIP